MLLPSQHCCRLHLPDAFYITIIHGPSLYLSEWWTEMDNAQGFGVWILKHVGRIEMIYLWILPQRSLALWKRDSEQSVFSGKEAEAGRGLSTWFTLLETRQIFTWQTLGALMYVWPTLFAWPGLLSAMKESKDMCADAFIHTHTYDSSMGFLIYKILGFKPKHDPYY